MSAYDLVDWSDPEDRRIVVKPREAIAVFARGRRLFITQRRYGDEDSVIEFFPDDARALADAIISAARRVADDEALSL